VLTFHVGHPDLQNDRAPVLTRSRGDPRAAHLVRVERRSDRQRPSISQLAYERRQTRQPTLALRRRATRCGETLRDFHDGGRGMR
jgi:hypothetical protein